MLIWAIVPLWLLAGQMIAALLSLPEKQDRLLVWGEAVFYAVLLAYCADFDVDPYVEIGPPLGTKALVFEDGSTGSTETARFDFFNGA